MQAITLSTVPWILNRNKFIVKIENYKVEETCERFVQIMQLFKRKIVQTKLSNRRLHKRWLKELLTLSPLVEPYGPIICNEH